MATTREPTQFAFRSQKDVGVCNAPPTSSAVELAVKPTEEVRSLKYSPDGQYLAWSVSSEIRIVDAQTLAAVAVINHSGAVDVQFSPKGTYLITWERFSKVEDAEPIPNLKVWDSASGELKGGFIQKSYSTNALQWTDDEKYCVKLFAGEVRFYTPDALKKAALTLKLDGITEFSVSPGLSPSIAVFVPERKSKMALVHMYTVGNFARPAANKTLAKADKVEFYWHSLGTNLLVLTQTDVDKTGRNYYGESNLLFMAAAGNFDCRVILDREGPIHDVAWNPVEKEFVVVYGYMPAKTALFNHRVEMVFDFGIAPRNFVRFNPHGRVLSIAGFGNLSGQIDLWDRKKLKKICTVDGHGASFCEWGPDGRYLMAATLSPRLRVDNGIRIWHYSGALVYRQEMDVLYQVDWRPAPVSRFPQRSALSPVPDGIAVAADATAQKNSKPAGAYRPPHARNRGVDDTSAPRSLSDMAERKAFGGAVGQRVTPGASPDMTASSGEKKKRRNRKKNKDDTENAGNKKSNGDTADASYQAATAAPVAESGGLSGEIDVLKKIKQLKKKLGQIENLAKRRDQGELLEDNQLTKIETKPQIESEIAALGGRLSSLSSQQ
ncbi:eukaryotic translation initiation factor eIF2A-domain-containing protein [Coemansia spiralis]|nr:eukaryotic translation initiation factor eIF2A-domain-containing protein [Coemansia spiralis]